MASGGRFRRVALDLAPLRVSPDFRWIWGGLAVSALGAQFSLVGVFVQVTALTGSTAAVGFTGLVWLLALVVGSIGAASILDRWDRKKLLLLAQVGLASGSGILLLGASMDRPPLALVYVGIAILAAFSAVDGPTRTAMTPRLVGDDLLPSAQALNQVIWNTTALIGPALAGLLIQQTSVAWAYGVDVLSAIAMFVAVTRIRPMRPDGAEEAGTRRQAIREGFAYVKRNRLLQSTFVIDIIAMVFGLPRALFTFLAVEQFGHGPEIVGFLFAAPAIGAVLGAASSGWVRHIRRQGDAVVWAVAGWGTAIVVFGLSGDRLWLGLLALALAGWADVISAIFRSTILQTATPDHLRGRISGIHILVVTGGPRLGDLEAGLVAAWTTPTFSVVSGGLVCIVGAWLTALAYPELRRYRAATRAEGGA